MWFKILLISIFLSSNISLVFSEVVNIYNSKIIDNNSEYCKKNNDKFTDNKILLEEINFITIDADSQRKWFKNLFKATIWHGINTPKKYKKKFKAKIKVNFKDDIKCTFKAKIRIHGDQKDHIQTTMDGNMYSSMHVQLIEDNIDSITKFILFIPLTRNADNEVLTTTLFRHLNLLAPRTMYIDTYVNGTKIKYLFQEKITKEMLENNNFPEGPIIEASHRFLWPNKKTNFIDARLVQARVTNQNWSIKNNQNIKKTTLALSKFNEAYIDNRSDFNTNRLAFKNKKAQQTLAEFEAIMSALGGFHGLSAHNIKFYYDPTNLTFLPIYYDGDVNILNKNSNSLFYKDFDSKISHRAKIGAKSSIQKIKKIDTDDLIKDLKNNGLTLNKKDFLLIKKKLIGRLIDISKIKKNENKFRFVKAYFSNYVKKNENKRLVFFDDNLNKIKVCEFKIDQCYNEDLSIEDLSLLFSGKLFKNDHFYIFASNNYDNYLNGIFLDNSRIIENKFNKILIDGTEVLFSKNISIIKDDVSKKITFTQNEPSQIVLFKYGKINGWEVNFFGIKTDNYDNSKNIYSGCVNFYEVELLDVSISVRNSSCEDALNIVRSMGYIENINVYEAKHDAIDLDFSNINIGNVLISNAGNDCVDMSYGNYNIEQLDLSSCRDKAVSVGEKSNFSGKTVEIKNSLIGIAIKDSSTSTINTLIIENATLCAAAYRKKQEFYGAYLRINNFLCNKNEIYYQNGSTIEIINEL